jgi:hypothetical protein
MKLESHLSSLGSIVSMWLPKFQNLTIQDTDAFVKFVNVLYNASASVAYYIRHGGSEEDILKLQNSLGVIQDSIDYIAFENILKVLNYSIELSRGDLSPDKKRERTSHINSLLAYLKKSADEIKCVERENIEILPSIKGDNVEKFREIYRKVIEWKHDIKNRDKPISEFPNIKRFRDLFSGIPRKDLVNEWEIDYSDKSLEKIADWLGSEYMCLDAEEMANYS